MEHKFNEDFCKEDIHGFFELSYASYLAIPRSILQSMPAQWQHEFTALLEVLQDNYSGYDMEYTVHARNKGKFISDPLRNYERGRRYVEPKPYDYEAKHL